MSLLDSKVQQKHVLLVLRVQQKNILIVLRVQQTAYFKQNFKILTIFLIVTWNTYDILSSPHYTHHCYSYYKKTFWCHGTFKETYLLIMSHQYFRPANLSIGQPFVETTVGVPNIFTFHQSLLFSESVHELCTGPNVRVLRYYHLFCAQLMQTS